MNVNQTINQDLKDMKFNLQVVEKGEILSNHTDLTLDQVQDIIEGFFESSNFVDLVKRKQYFDKKYLEQCTKIDNHDWTQR